MQSPDKEKPRKPRILSMRRIDEDVITKVKLLAIARGMGIADMYEYLIRKGLACEVGKVKIPDCMDSIEMYIIPSRESSSGTGAIKDGKRKHHTKKK